MSHRLPLVILLLAWVAFGQEFRGTITGRVTDPQKATIARVQIVATQTETGATYRVVSDENGLFTVPFLLPGLYSLSLEAPGFKRYRRDGIRLSANEDVGLEIQLELGATSESVVVTSDAPLVETATASTGQVVNALQISNIPLNGGTPLVLAQLAFGVIPTGIPTFVRPFDNAGPSGFSMGGFPDTNNEILLDGMPNSNGTVGTVAYNPPADAVSEIKVESFQADAALGHTGGGTANLILKSGTNSLHGSAYEFSQIPKLQATPFFTNLAGGTKTPHRFNQWGFTLGGPVYIPKIFDGRNKLFFFFAYEGVRDGLPEPSTVTVPTAAERTGDFSQQLAVGSSYTIYDPATGAVQGARIARTPFPTNIIPTSRLNPVAQKLLQYYPASNLAGRNDGANNFESSQVERNWFNNELTRVDATVSSSDRLFVTFRRNFRDDRTGIFSNDIATGNDYHRYNDGAALDNVYTFTPTLLMDTRLNWTRYGTGLVPYSTNTDLTSLGFPASLPAAAEYVKIPEIDFSNYQSIGTDLPSQVPFDIFQIFNTVTKVTGRQTWKFGGDFRLYRQSSFSPGDATGQLTFGNSWTNGPLDNSASAPLGQDLAGFLLGLPTGGNFPVNALSTIQAGYFALFAQDDFRIRPNLFLNLGLRYERDLPDHERYYRSVDGFDFTSLNPVSAAASAAYNLHPIAQIPAGSFTAPGGLLFSSANSPNFYSTNAHYFSPRFGFSWTPGPSGGKTVIRGGVGVFFAPIGIAGLNQEGFSANTPLVATNNGYLTPAVNLSNPFASGIQQPTGSSLGLSTYAGQSLTFYNPHPLNPYSLRWTLDVQRQLPWKSVVEVNFVINHAVHLPVDTPLDFVPKQYYSTSPARDQTTINLLTSNVTNPFAGLLPGTTLNGSTVALNQLLMQYPEFTGITQSALNIGSSYFHLAQARFEKRFSTGLQVLANYQVSKLIEMRSRLNPFDTSNLAKQIASDDRPMRLTVSLNYDLPFGKGKAIGGNAGKLVDRVAGGWSINTVYVRQSGAPLTWGDVIYNGGDLHLESNNIHHTFDTTQFNTVSAQQLSWNVRTFPAQFSNLRADGPDNVDFSLIKNAQIYERLRLQIRGEFFNVLNHVLFSAPNTSPTSSAFGTITGQANVPRGVQLGLKLLW